MAKVHPHWFFVHFWLPEHVCILNETTVKEVLENDTLPVGTLCVCVCERESSEHQGQMLRFYY